MFTRRKLTAVMFLVAAITATALTVGHAKAGWVDPWGVYHCTLVPTVFGPQCY